MHLYTFDDVRKQADDSAFWWQCTNEDCPMSSDGHAVAAHNYDWLYWYKDIPESDLLEHPELKAEWEQARTNYLNRTNNQRNTQCHY